MIFHKPCFLWKEFKILVYPASEEFSKADARLSIFRALLTIRFACVTNHPQHASRLNPKFFKLRVLIAFVELAAPFGIF